MKSETVIARLTGKISGLVFNERVGSGVGAVFFSFWIAQRLYFNYERHFALTLDALAWWLITFQYAVFVVSYLTRDRAAEQARGFVEAVFPFFCAALPFALIVDYPFRPPTMVVKKLVPLSAGLIIGGTLVVIAGIMALRKSFSIMTEVRRPVYGGIYRVTRHPMYLGSMLTALGTLFLFFSPWNLLVLAVFYLCQLVRATREERKIARICPEYRDYAQKVGWLGIIGRW